MKSCTIDPCRTPKAGQKRCELMGERSGSKQKRFGEQIERKQEIILCCVLNINVCWCVVFWACVFIKMFVEHRH